MFTGIIESLGVVTQVTSSGTNKTFIISSSVTPELKIDQSVAHNGVCLTVTEINGTTYSVTAIKETLDRTNLSTLLKGDEVNLERCMIMGGRLDGHVVQGHVDNTGTCTSIINENGSWRYSFSHQKENDSLIVEKGSICINGVSLTVASCSKGAFEVAVIPYTYKHTTFKNLKVGSIINIEYDILGKYVAKLFSAQLKNS